MRQEFREGEKWIEGESSEETTVEETHHKSGQVGDNRTGIYSNWHLSRLCSVHRSSAWLNSAYDWKKRKTSKDRTQMSQEASPSKLRWNRARDEASLLKRNESYRLELDESAHTSPDFSAIQVSHNLRREASVPTFPFSHIVSKVKYGHDWECSLSSINFIKMHWCTKRLASKPQNVKTVFLTA